MNHRILAAGIASFAFALSGTPAFADHDTICTPGPTPVCVSGHEHTLDDARAAAKSAVDASAEIVFGAFFQGYAALDAIPEPICVPKSRICVTGGRAAAKFAYLVGGGVALGSVYCAIYVTLGSRDCIA